MIIVRSPCASPSAAAAPICRPTTRSRGLPDRGGDRQIRLRHRHPAVHARHLISSIRRSSTSTLSSDVKHRSSAKLLDAGFETPQIEITTLADIPAGTGLGSSGSFTTALLKALYAHEAPFIHPGELAEQACHIEIDILGEPIGKQDQYIAAFGGITCFTFRRGRQRGRGAAEDLDGRNVRSRRKPAAVLHRLFARRRQHPEGSGQRGPSRTTSE